MAEPFWPNADVVCPDTTTISRAEWLELRREGLGGSDAAAAMGRSPWVSRMALYLDKTDPVEDKDTERFEAGRRMEEPIAQWFADETKLKIVHQPVMLRSLTHSFMLANPDRWVANAFGDWALLECKNVDRSKAHEWKDGPPIHYRAQVQHYLAVTGLDTCYMATLTGGNKFDWFTIARDDEFIAEMIRQEEAMWTLIEMRRPPDVDGDASTLAALKERFDAQEGSEVQVGDDFVALLRVRAAIKVEQDLVKTRLAEIEGKMLVLMGEAEIAKQGERVVATYKSVKKASYTVKASEHRQWNVPKEKK